MEKLTIQALLDTEWLDIAELNILEPHKGSASASELSYELEYAISYLDKRDEHACSLALTCCRVLFNMNRKSGLVF